MNKLFVITFKRPALDLEKAIYGSEFDYVYDCEAFHIPELVDIKLKDAQNKYQDVEIFECEDYEYVEFCKNAEAYAHFTKTGEHSMKPLEDLAEDYKPSFALWVLDGNDNTWKMYKGMDTAEFDKDDFLLRANKQEYPAETYINNYVDAIILPNDGSSPENITEDVSVGTDAKTVTIRCDVRIARKTSEASFDYNVGIDDVGQIVFTPYDIGTRFCPEGEELVVDDNVKLDTVELTAMMISDTGNYDYFMGTDDIGQFVITPEEESTSFLTASVNNSLNLVTDDSKESIAEALGSEMDTNMIIYRFMRGDIDVFVLETPTSNLIHVQELDTTYGKTTYQYYYDPEADAIGSYLVKKD